MGGDRRLLPAAAGAARHGCAGHALADPRALRPARGSRPWPSAFAASWRRSAGAPTSATRRGLREGGHEQLAVELERAWLETTAARSSACTSARRTCSGRSGRTPAGPPRRPTRSCRCWPPTPACAPSSAAGSPRTGAVSGAGAGASGCRSAPTRRGSRDAAEAGVRTVCVELTSAFGEGSWEHLQPLAGRARAGARPDRQGDDLAGVERAGLPGRGRLPRLPPPHHLPPQPLEQRRRAPTTTRPRWRSPGPTRPTS